MATREKRELELTSQMNNPLGRHQLLELLRRHMNVPAGAALPVGTPIIQTILDHEFAGLVGEG